MEFWSLEPRLIACLPPLACFDSSLDFQGGGGTCAVARGQVVELVPLRKQKRLLPLPAPLSPLLRGWEKPVLACQPKVGE